jgi:hypothetical protein
MDTHCSSHAIWYIWRASRSRTDGQSTKMHQMMILSKPKDEESPIHVNSTVVRFHLLTLHRNQRHLNSNRDPKLSKAPPTPRWSSPDPYAPNVPCPSSSATPLPTASSSSNPYSSPPNCAGTTPPTPTLLRPSIPSSNNPTNSVPLPTQRASCAHGKAVMAGARIISSQIHGRGKSRRGESIRICFLRRGRGGIGF